MSSSLESLPTVGSPKIAAKPRVLVATSLEEVDALEGPWRALDEQVAYPLVQFDWMRAALAVFAADSCPHIVAIVRGDRAVAVAPLMTRRVHGVRRMFLAGVGELFEPADLVAVDEPTRQRLVSAIARTGMPLVLERMPADSPSLAAFRRRFWGRAVIITRPQATSPYITLDESWLSPEHHLNSGRRSDLRRARRKAEQSGPVTIEIHSPDLDELPHLLDTAFDVEARSWKGEAGTALARDAVRAVFYRQYAQAACTAGTLRICFLRIGDRVAAMQLAIEDSAGFWLLKVGYDDRFAACSPGLLLMRETIRYAVEAGLARYEFLGRSEVWTQVWTQREHPYVTWRIYPVGVRGIVALVADSVAAIARKWRRSS
jgi:CelD/BcsL family acetyltransferase involved in cellulose biosynthesis